MVVVCVFFKVGRIMAEMGEIFFLLPLGQKICLTDPYNILFMASSFFFLFSPF